MTVAIRVHTPELSAAIQGIAFGHGWKWICSLKPEYGIPFNETLPFLVFDERGIRHRRLIAASDSTVRDCYPLVLDAKTDMPQIVEFFKTGKITKEKEMGKRKIEIDRLVSLTYDDRKGTHLPLRVMVEHGDSRWITHKEACKMRDALLEHFPLEDAKPEKRIVVERCINNVDFKYTPAQILIGQIDDGDFYGFGDCDLLKIQEWLDAIKEAKKSN